MEKRETSALIRLHLLYNKTAAVKSEVWYYYRAIFVGQVANRMPTRGCDDFVLLSIRFFALDATGCTTIHTLLRATRRFCGTGW